MSVDSHVRCKMTLMMSNLLYPTDCIACGSTRGSSVQYLNKTMSYTDYRTANVLVEWDFKGWKLQYLHMDHLFYMFPVALHVPSCFTYSQLHYMFPVVLHVPSFTCSQLFYTFPVVLHVPSCFTRSQLFYTFPVILCVLS